MEQKNKRGSHSKESEKKATVNKKNDNKKYIKNDKGNVINESSNNHNIVSEKGKVKKQNVKKKSGFFRKLLKFILCLLIFIFIAAGVFLGYSTIKNGWGLQGILATIVGHDSNTVEDLGEFKILLLGVSTDITARLTDTIMVASYNPKTQKASLLSIPRDTYVGKDKTNPSASDKINSLYQKDAQKTLDAVNSITGLDLKYYMVVDMDVMVDLVDEIGGVEFNVPIDMDYDDPTQNLHIHLKAGLQTINGQEAEYLLRFRKNSDGTSYPTEYGDNDYGRMRTQREFIKEAVKQTIVPKNLVKIKSLIDIIYKNIDTNIDVDTIKDYLPYAVEFNTDNLQTATLPGESVKLQDIIWVFVHNKKETDALVQQLFFENTAEQTTTGEEAEEIDVSNVKIELLNGSGDSTKLSKATTLLKKLGYNVYKTGSTSVTDSTTIVKNSIKTTATITSKLKSDLGIGNISNSATTSSTADITIIIGKDYK